MKSVTIAQVLQDSAKKLQPKKITCAADKTVGRLEAEILLAHILKKDRVWLLANPNRELPKPADARFKSFVRRRTKHEPIAYILGEREFYGRTFHVTADVLIPRPETELIIDLAKGLPQPPLSFGGSGSLVWDVGTGSGALGTTLALELPRTQVIATDISTPALTLARKNARRLGVKNIRFLRADLLDAKMTKLLAAESHKHEALTVTANLPYLPNADKKKLDPDVVKYEPSNALFSGEDGLDHITKFLDHLAFSLPQWHFKRIAIFVEFDPPQAKKLEKLAKSLFHQATIEIKKDLAGRKRVLRISETRTI